MVPSPVPPHGRDRRRAGSPAPRACSHPGHDQAGLVDAVPRSVRIPTPRVRIRRSGDGGDPAPALGHRRSLRAVRARHRTWKRPQQLPRVDRQLAEAVDAAGRPGREPPAGRTSSQLDCGAHRIARPLDRARHSRGRDLRGCRVPSAVVRGHDLGGRRPRSPPTSRGARRGHPFEARDRGDPGDGDRGAGQPERQRAGNDPRRPGDRNCPEL